MQGTSNGRFRNPQHTTKNTVEKQIQLANGTLENGKMKTTRKLYLKIIFLVEVSADVEILQHTFIEMYPFVHRLTEKIDISYVDHFNLFLLK